MLKYLKTSVMPQELDPRNDQDMPDDQYGGIWVGSVMDSPDSKVNIPVTENEDKQENDVEKVMKVLKWHVLTCLGDMTLALCTMWYCIEWMKAVAAAL